MHSNRMWTRWIPAAVLVLLCVPWIDGCGTHDDRDATIQRTISELREKADFWEANRF